MEGEAPRDESMWKASAARLREPGAGEVRQVLMSKSEEGVEEASETAAAAVWSEWRCMRRLIRRRAEGNVERSATREGSRSAETRGDRRSCSCVEEAEAEAEAGELEIRW
jgi:hypothetical protein